MIFNTYLTETNLHDILKDVFPNDLVEHHKKYNKTNIDFKISLSSQHPIRKVLQNNTSSSITLFIEFDGIYHFTNIKFVVKDFDNGLGLCKWKQLDDDSTIYGLRIPYYVQLDETMTKEWFNIDNTYINYPHGFIENKVILPREFCHYGELRLIKDLKNLPFHIGKSIFDSLLNKMIKIKSSGHDFISYPVFCSLFEYFYKEKYDFYLSIKYDELNKDDKKMWNNDPIFYCICRFKKKYEMMASWLKN